MEIRFVTQPFEDGTDLRDFLQAVAESSELMTLRIIVAWTKRSGLRRAAADLKAVRDRGGTVLAIVGVSEGGATQQGLDALMIQADESHVFHDTGRTFHPKVYLADSAAKALLLVGSHNFTAGGLAWNYEAAIWCQLDLSLDKDRRVRDDVVAYFDRLRADTAICLPLDSPTLEKMMADGSLIIQNEDSTKRAQKPAPDAPEDSDSAEPTEQDEDEPAPRTFGKSATTKRKAPTVTSAPRKPLPKRNAHVPTTGSVPGAPTPMTVIKRWYKQMDHTAAQQKKNPGSHTTGNLRLNEATFAIDHRRYFYEVFFGGLPWQVALDRSIEETWVPMQTVIDGDYVGDVLVRISHAPKRIAGQANVPTLLHWGNLGARLRENDYRNMYVTLERALGNEFALTIAEQPTGEFTY